jgi:hypothetical protein
MPQRGVDVKKSREGEPPGEPSQVLDRVQLGGILAP